MGILELFGLTPKPQKIVTSRPIFQFSSSFIGDDNELKKPAPAHLPFQHQPIKSVNDDIGGDDDEDDDDNDDDENGLIKPRPKPQSRLHLILHILNTIFTLVSLSLYITTVPLWNANFHHTRSIVSGDYTDGLVLAPLLVSLAISIYLLLIEHTPFRLRLRFAHSSKSLKPTTLVLLSLTILLTLGPTLTISATNCLALAWRSPARTKSGLIICNLANVFSQPCQPLLFQIGGLQIAAIVTGGLAWCVWFVVLAVAVRSWARQRREQKNAARDRRRRRHAKRSGRARAHRHRHRSRKDQSHARPDSEPTTNGKSSQGHDNRYRHNQTIRNHRDHDEVHGSRSNGWPSEQQLEISTGPLVAQKVRPKETIQVWLNGRYN